MARENELKNRAHARARDSEERLEAALKKAKTGGHADLLAAYARAQAETERLAVELEDETAEREDLAEEVQRLVAALPVGPSREAFHRLLDDRSGGKVAPLDLVDMLGHKGESYSQDIVELGLQLMAMRLTAEQAVNVTRAFVQLQHPDKVEGDDYRIPSSARFREWRRFLGPICHYLSLSVIKLAEKIHALHDATTKLGISVFQTAFRCELKNEVTGKITIVNVPLKFDIAPSGTAGAEADHMVAAMSTNVGRGVRASTGAVVSIHSDNAARGASAKYAKKVEEDLEKVKAAIQDHTTTHSEEMLDLVDAFLQLSPEQQAHVGEMHELGCSGHSRWRGFRRRRRGLDGPRCGVGHRPRRGGCVVLRRRHGGR